MLQRTINRINIFQKYRELFFQLVTNEIKLKYRNSILGYFWSVLNPLLIMVVKVIVFTRLFDRAIPNFPVYLLCGQMLFSFMSSSSSRSLHSVTGNAGILKKIYVPKYIFTFSSVTSELLTFIFSLGALVIVIVATKTPVTFYAFLIIIPIFLQYIFCIGLGLFLAQATVFFRDVQYIWSVIVTAWLFLCAIFYPVSILPDTVRYLVENYNPMYFYITMFRMFVIGFDHPVLVNIDIINLIIRGVSAAVLMLLLGYASFSWSKNKFILYI